MITQNFSTGRAPLGLPPAPCTDRMVSNLAATTRSLEGRPHLVVPVVMIAGPMVMNGSNGPLLYPANETNRSARLWNGVPLVVHHPEIIGKSYAGDPSVYSSMKVGVVFNAQAQQGRLTGEAWLDVERAKEVDPRVLQAVQNGQQLNVSTGLYSDNLDTPGNHDGIGYEGVATNYRPDHLAILPDQKGACSLEDGCGLLVNTANGPALPEMSF